LELTIFLSDRIYRIFWIFLFLSFLPPARRAYALSELEALQAGSRRDETVKGQSAFGGEKFGFSF
jgi:hypothetical protein